jgi:hypothetical protein
MAYRDVEQALGFLRLQLWVAPDSEKDQRLRASIEKHSVATERGFQFATAGSPVAVIRWEPGR